MADAFLVMIMDGAGWHTANDLQIPETMHILYLPPYSPELNPVEHLWDDLRLEAVGEHGHLFGTGPE